MAEDSAGSLRTVMHGPLDSKGDCPYVSLAAARGLRSAPQGRQKATL